jgi:hypothetical protein
MADQWGRNNVAGRPLEKRRRMSEPKKIKFEEIEEGDLIEVVQTHLSGLKLKREGTAADLVTGPGRSVWYQKGTQRQQVLAEWYGGDSRTEFFLLKREEKKDHLVVGTRILTGQTEAFTVVARTKTECDQIANQRNLMGAGICGDRTIYRAVKVG